ncbi:MAG TPA: hypothetical protein VLL57_01445 [Candidatus Binataceae bacterium]|nr:hypothetical protein [Candidatus Binataceae bacterium]
MKSRLFVSTAVAFAVVVMTGAAMAQLAPMGVPIPTTMVLAKPAPEQTFGNQTVVTVGVGDKTYKFILKDAYTNHRKVRWPDIWQYVRQFNPNFNAQGIDQEQFAKLQPGQSVTIAGMFAPMDRTFEVMSVTRSGGEKEHY